MDDEAIEGRAAVPRSGLDPVERFRAHWEEYDGASHVTASLEEARGRARELVGDATVARWADEALDGIADLQAPAEKAEVSLIVADLAVAETGQVGWAHGPGRPRAAGILPPRQVVLLAAGDVVESLAEGLARLYGGGRPPASVVLVAGPSRTADIEQRVIRGVHAPRTVDVVLYPAAG